MQSTVAIKREYNPNNHKAQKFTLWLGIVSMSMSFAGLTSAYIVRKSAGAWDNFEIPTIFFTSTFLIILSSVAMHVAHLSNKKAQKGMLTAGLWSTFFLGLAFCLVQLRGWNELVSQGIYLEGNVSGSFFYVITGMHFAHVLGGLLFLIIAALRSTIIYRRQPDRDTYVDRRNGKLRIRTELISLYWHFVGVLWIYLFIFLSINHS